MAVAIERAHHLGVVRLGPGLEEPARGGMHLDESFRRDRGRREQRIDAFLGLFSRHHHQRLLAFLGIDADAAQRIEVRFHRVARRQTRQLVAMREAPVPEAARARGRDRPARAQRLREPRAAPMVGEMHEELVAARLQRLQEVQLAARLHDEALALPRAVHPVDLGDGRMAREHVASIGIDQRVDLGVGRALLEHVEHRRGQQHVAMVAQLHHQHALHGREIDGVGDQGRGSCRG